jgi:hypothetical protein
VAWDKTASGSCTNEILLGTDTGEVVGMTIEYTPNQPKKINVLNFNRVIQLPNKHPIHGIQYEIFSGVPRRISVVVATP